MALFGDLELDLSSENMIFISINKNAFVISVIYRAKISFSLISEKLPFGVESIFWRGVFRDNGVFGGLAPFGVLATFLP